ncbi:MAG TPA: hypothetical protein PLX97_08870 [Gemmatales bacterium]|nr:hypothetical protein [Gemmatales bacterium]
MRYRNRNHGHLSRAGLTLVEMLIALALSIFIMAILSEAFVKGLEVFGQYKALADLDQRLRTVANILRRDLQAPHFEGSKKLSECTASGKTMPSIDGLPASTLNPTQAALLQRQLAPYRFVSPSEGFFSVEEWANRAAGATMFFEGQDTSNRPSYRDQLAFDALGNVVRSSDVLHFTARLEGNEPDKFFYGKTRLNSAADNGGVVGSRYDSISNGLYTSQAAEMLYFLQTDETSLLPAVGTPGGPVLTFNLYRQAWLLVPSRFSNGTAPLGDPTYANINQFRVENDLSGFLDPGNGVFYNTMSDVQHRARRVDARAVRSTRVLSVGGLREGSDILLTNVISFDVKVFDPFAYKIPFGAVGGGPGSGRGAYVDIGDTVQTAPTGVNPCPTAAGDPNDNLQPAFGGVVNNVGVSDVFDTGTQRFDGGIGTNTFTPAATPATHPFPFNSIQITIRVFEPKSRQTRQITIIQDM